MIFTRLTFVLVVPEVIYTMIHSHLDMPQDTKNTALSKQLFTALYRKCLNQINSYIPPTLFCISTLKI